MNRITRLKPLISMALAVAALGAASMAQARTDVSVSIGINAPVARVAYPQPVYVQPQPVRVAPRPVVVHQPQRVQHPGRGGPWGDADRDGVPNIRDRQSRFYDPRAVQRAGWRDSDRDGVPNRYDQAPRNPRYR